jgi:flagellar hook-length control protein FliK
MQEKGLVARLETETTSAKTAILDNLPALRERLAEQGLRIERFEVDVSQRDSSGMPDRSHDPEQQGSPVAHSERMARPRIDPAVVVRGEGRATNSTTGLNVIV